MPAWPIRNSKMEVTHPTPDEEAIAMTWDQAAMVLAQPIAMFGLPD